MRNSRFLSLNFYCVVFLICTFSQLSAQGYSGQQGKFEPKITFNSGGALTNNEINDIMTIDFVKTDIREVMRSISMAYGLNIVVDQEVSQSVTIYLEDIGVVDGIRAICNAYSLDMIREGQIFQIKKREKKTTTVLKMNMKKMDLDVENQDIKKFIKDFAKKTGLSVLAGKNLEGKISGSWKNQTPLEGFKAIMHAHDYEVTKKNGFYIVQNSADGGSNRGSGIPGGYPPGRRRSGPAKMNIDVQDGFASVQLENANMADVLKKIADETGMNIVLFGDIRETINANLEKTPIAKLISTLLKGSKYTFLLTEEGTLLVGSKDPKTPAGKILTSYDMYFLKHLQAKNITKILPKSISKANITIINEHNAVLIMGTSAEIESVKSYFDLIDVPIPQVLLECVIVEYKRGGNSELGLRTTDNTSRNGITAFADFTSENVVSKSFGDANVGIGFLNSQFLYELNALESKDQAKILAMPKITTLNGNKASIKVTNTSYFKVESATKEGNPLVDFKPFNDGTTISLTPFVTKSGQVSLEIKPEIKSSAITGDDASAPAAVSTRSLSTTVSLQSGQTVMLGGLIQTSKSFVRDFVPIFGSIPVIGYLFSYKKEVESTTELVIFVTPHVQQGTGEGIHIPKVIKEMKQRDGDLDLENNIEQYLHQPEPQSEGGLQRKPQAEVRKKEEKPVTSSPPKPTTKPYTPGKNTSTPKATPTNKKPSYSAPSYKPKNK